MGIELLGQLKKMSEGVTNISADLTPAVFPTLEKASSLWEKQTHVAGRLTSSYVCMYFQCIFSTHNMNLFNPVFLSAMEHKGGSSS